MKPKLDPTTCAPLASSQASMMSIMAEVTLSCTSCCRRNKASTSDICLMSDGKASEQKVPQTLHDMRQLVKFRLQTIASLWKQTCSIPHVQHCLQLEPPQHFCPNSLTARFMKGKAEACEAGRLAQSRAARNQVCQGH